MTPEQLRETANRVEECYKDYRFEVVANAYVAQLRAHADALEELARLRARLEIDFAIDGNGKRVPFPAGGPDGIACRDETIRLLEAALAESERKCERLKFHAEAAMSWIEDKHPEEAKQYLPDFVDAYRAEFKEES